jgi:hypothetical protein
MEEMIRIHKLWQGAELLHDARTPSSICLLHLPPTFVKTHLWMCSVLAV